MERRLLALILSTVCMGMGYPQEPYDADKDIADVFGKDEENLISCSCMPFYNCKWNTTANNRGNTGVDSTGNTNGNTSGNDTGSAHGDFLIDVRIDPEEPAKECSDYLDICCFPADTVTTPTVPMPSAKPIHLQNECGNRQEDGVGFKIIGANNEASYGEFPWMTAVIRRDKRLKNTILNVMECGGSIIHPQVVLTAAHCVRRKKDLFIRAGEWDTQTTKEFYPTQDRDVKEVIIHEHFYAGGAHNDVALLVLDKPLEMSPVVGTLCLPEQDENMDERNCVVSGWGKDVYGKEGTYQVIMKRVELPIVAKEPCEEALRKTRLGQSFVLHESLLCAGGEVGKDACKGDGGSPLACPSKDNPNVYVQAGIVAWGIDCGTKVPAVYVNVPHLREWIDTTIARLDLQG